MSACSTKQKLLSLIEDVEIVTKQLFEVMCTAKTQRPDDLDTSQLLQLLIQRDKELQDTLHTAQEQGEQQRKLDALKAEVERRDNDIRTLQKSLKEAETILSGAIYQAKQKLQSINQARKRKISSEELIKYAHKISAHNTVAAPPTWQPGDTRRPYPTEMDIRQGLLGRADLPINPQPQLGAGHSAAGMGGPLGMDRPGDHPLGQPHPSMPWTPSIDIPIPAAHHPAAHTAPHSHLDTKGHAKENEDVELMSSDSSSSSSSDE